MTKPVKSIIDVIGREEAFRLMGEAVKEAHEKALQAGLPSPVEIDGVWCAQYPDGRIEPLESEASGDGANTPQEPST